MPGGGGRGGRGSEEDRRPGGSDGEGEEAVTVVRRRVARQPTQEEIRLHRITHLPYREWCPECVAGAANDHAHPRRKMGDDDRLEVPEIHWDYCFPRDKAQGEQSVVVLVGRDRETKLR